MSTNPDLTSSNGKAHGKDSAFTHEGFSSYATALADELKQALPDKRPVDLSARLETLRVRPTDTIPESPTCLTIEQGGKSYSIGSLGNLSVVAGKAKARKTFAVSFAVAAAVACVLILNRVKGSLPIEQQTVLLFDTEQARHHVLKVVKRICKLSDVAEPENLIVYSLRSCSHQERLALVDYAINNTPNLGLVVIDGIRDLAVDPVLDAEQASHLMTHLLQWTDRLNIHILCVLHQNKGDSNLRGHIGTELVNKSETVIMVNRDMEDREVSIVSPEHCRDREFEPFGFSIDEQGLPYLVDESEHDANQRDSKTTRKKKGQKAVANSMSLETMRSVVVRAFDKVEHLSYAQLRTNVMEASQFIGESLIKNEAELFIQRTVLLVLLTKVRPENQRWDSYCIGAHDLFNHVS